jgi:hypothetical protein
VISGRGEDAISSSWHVSATGSPLRPCPSNSLTEKITTADLQYLVRERRVRVGDGARQDNGPDPFGHQPFQRALCNNSCISWRRPFGCYLARGRAQTTHFPRYSHDKAEPPQIMNACLVDSKEAAPCLGQGKPAQKLAPFAGHQKSRTLAAAPVEEPNQPSSRRIGDRIWVNGLSVSRGY